MFSFSARTFRVAAIAAAFLSLTGCELYRTTSEIPIHVGGETFIVKKTDFHDFAWGRPTDPDFQVVVDGVSYDCASLLDCRTQVGIVRGRARQKPIVPGVHIPGTPSTSGTH